MNENNLFRNVEVTRYENGCQSIINEKLVNDRFLDVYMNNVFIEKILCVDDKMEELAIGNYFQCVDILPEEIVKNFSLDGDKANLNKTTNSIHICDYRRNCGCMINEAPTNILKTIKPTINYNVIDKIFKNFQDSSALFKETAGVHGAGLYDLDGNNIFFAIDLARHNCITKASGYIIKNSLYGEVESNIIMLSSRVNAELIKMCYKSGLNIILSRGAPSYMAYLEAKKLDITLISFVRDGRFTVMN